MEQPIEDLFNFIDSSQRRFIIEIQGQQIYVSGSEHESVSAFMNKIRSTLEDTFGRTIDFNVLCDEKGIIIPPSQLLAYFSKGEDTKFVASLTRISPPSPLFLCPPPKEAYQDKRFWCVVQCPKGSSSQVRVVVTDSSTQFNNYEVKEQTTVLADDSPFRFQVFSIRIFSNSMHGKIQYALVCICNGIEIKSNPFIVKSKKNNKE